MVRNIAISGAIATGTTSLGRALAQKLGFRFIEGGEEFAKMHQELNISEEEVLKRPDQLDRAFDERIKKMFSQGKHQIIESHLAGFNAQSIEGVFKIRLICQQNGIDRIDIRSQRIAQRDNIKVDEARAKLLQREGGNREKYQRLYGVDPYEDGSLYDLTINTFYKNEEETVKAALEAIEKAW